MKFKKDLKTNYSLFGNKGNVSNNTAQTMLMKAHPGSVETIIDILKHMEVDGETMEHIICQVGMEDQMLRQLLLKADTETLVQLIMERRELGNA